MAIQLFLPIILLSFAPAAISNHAPPTPVAPAIVVICSKTNHPDVCHSSIQLQPHSASHLDAASALSLLVRSTVEHTMYTRNMATYIAGDNKKSETVEMVMAQCQSSYDDALDSLESAMVAVARNDKAMARYMFGSAIRDYGSCRQGYMDVPGISSLLEHDELLVQMASNCLDVLELL